MHTFGQSISNATFSALECCSCAQTDYVDLMLIHWPTSGGKSSDPECQIHGPKYNATSCRLTSWKTLLDLQKEGKARAVGVSNYNVDHLQEIIDAGLPLPSVNQCPYNPYLASAQAELLAMCKKHNIIFNSYSPLGIPDWHQYAGKHVATPWRHFLMPSRFCVETETKQVPNPT